LHRLSDFGIKMITLAPELPGAQELAASLFDKGILCSIGHSDADYETSISAITNGFSSVTHCFNQLRPFHQREPGVLGAALLKPELAVELIADGIHLHPATLELVLKLKGPEKIFLVSDAMAPTGMPNGKYQTPEGELTLNKGSLTNQNGDLAGSVLTLEQAVKNFMDYTGCELTDALRMATYNPARYLGINKRKGSVYPGKDADLVALTPDFEVVMTMVEGEVISGLISLD
ncbi:MAG: N-acetylglucosamine-6-phosphate deacetylase, partial [Firmicutes bacterium]|nr:N-acetylglucosamine-6-phosphate deacetylase [Bacillota bacterium]